jgi:hypothetical protein
MYEMKGPRLVLRAVSRLVAQLHPAPPDLVLRARQQLVAQLRPYPA